MFSAYLVLMAAAAFRLGVLNRPAAHTAAAACAFINTTASRLFYHAVNSQSHKKHHNGQNNSSWRIHTFAPLFSGAPVLAERSLGFLRSSI